MRSYRVRKPNGTAVKFKRAWPRERAGRYHPGGPIGETFAGWEQSIIK